MADVMVLVDEEDEEVEEEEYAAGQEEDDDEEDDEEEEEAAADREELPKEIPKHVHIHRVTALVNGNIDWMANGLQALQGELFPRYLCLKFLERGKGRGKERERNIDMQEKHGSGSVASHMPPNQGPDPQPNHVP